MGETFYSILGVRTDAPPTKIRRAYREKVKETHPDVSDNPDASRQFRRLTTARDVLLDSDERTTYDRLGHNAYVRKHVEASVWEPTPTERHAATRGYDGPKATKTATKATQTAADSTKRRRRNRQHTQKQRQWTSQRAQKQHARASRQRTRSDGGYANESWQQAPDAYQSTRTGFDEQPSSPWGSVVGGVRQIGLWAVVHIVLIVSALVTGWLLVSSASTDPAMSAATGLFLTLLVGVVVTVSALHLLIELY